VALILILIAVYISLPVIVANFYQGIWSFIAVIAAHFTFGGFARPIMCVGFLSLITFAFDLAVFVIALTFPPYTSGCVNSTYKGCEILKAAIALVAVLWS
jgi:hypothetical protein